MREGDLVADRYRLLRPIGAGAMGAVWAVRHELLGRDLALKVCTPGDRISGEARDLFLREVRIVGKLRHPNVVDIADAGDAGRDGLYLAMELLEGESLAQRIAAGPLSPAEALAVASEVCSGLVAAHAAGVVHRDLKPENVFLARGPSGGLTPKLLDFGVSSALGVTTLRGKLFGTPAYMSPEQALGEVNIDHRADVWALGVVLYEMLTGRLPFRAESYTALLPLIIEAPYAALPASTPSEVRTVVAGCLAKDRGDRYPTAEALRAAIDRALAALPADEVAAMRGRFFAEGGHITAATAHALPGTVRAGPPSARTARFGLALAILALPLAVGVAAVATGARARRASVGADGFVHGATGTALPLEATGAPAASTPEGSAESPCPPEPTVLPVLAATSADVDGGAVAPARAPAPARDSGGLRRPSSSFPRSRVTRVNNAGF